MKTKVFRVYCFAGTLIDQTPQTPVKTATVYMPESVRGKGPSPEGKAQMLAYEVLKLDIINDPQFKSGCHWTVTSEEVDLSGYGTPNLVASDGSKVWRN